MKPVFLLTAVALAVGPIAAEAAPAAKFLTDAIKGDTSEMTLGAYAAHHGQSAAVRAFGTTLATDHSMARAQASAVARRMHVAVPGGMMPEASAEYRKLQRLHGAAFDREFASYMVKDHRKDIATFEDQAKSGDHETAALARMQLPVLRKHLKMAESLG